MLTYIPHCREEAKSWTPEKGVWLVWWMRYQIFAPILILQFLNLFWYFLIWRIAYRYVHGCLTAKAAINRSAAS